MIHIFSKQIEISNNSNIFMFNNKKEHHPKIKDN